MSKTLVGIDLGTTYSLVAILQDGRPVVLPNAIGETLTPSVVGLDDDGTVLVGAPARARLTTAPERTAAAFKRDMGTPRVYTLGGRNMTAPELSAVVLASLKRDAEHALGRAIDEAVVTVPAYFGDAQRQATRDAASIAGLNVERIINEPTAAALAYGLGARDRELRAVVVDLGGGTFDVTVLEIIEGVIEIQASAGDTRLGGEDFDAALAAVVEARVGQAHRGADLDARARARVRAAVEKAKRLLSSETTARLALPDLSLGKGLRAAFETVLTRDEAEHAWAPLLARLQAPIARALRDASLSPAQIDEVLLVGGATRMPCIGRLVAHLFGRLPLRTLPPDEAVAMGAAVQAALKGRDAAVEDMVATDVAPFSLGIDSGVQYGGQFVGGVVRAHHRTGNGHPCEPREAIRDRHGQPAGDPAQGLPG